MGQARILLVELSRQHGLDPKQHEKLFDRATSFLVGLHACERTPSPREARKRLIQQYTEKARYYKDPLRTALRSFYAQYHADSQPVKPDVKARQGVREILELREKEKRSKKYVKQNKHLFQPRHFDVEFGDVPPEDEHVHAHLTNHGEVVIEEDNVLGPGIISWE